MKVTQELTSALTQILPAAELVATNLFDAPPLRLLLLRDTQAIAELQGEAMLRVMNNPLYWVFCWASGRVLARYLLDYPEGVSGKRVVDFGCGSGVVAIAAAMAGAKEVIACDLDPLALTATRHNAMLNNVELTITNGYHAIEGDIDVILVADVLYDRENLPWLQGFVERANEVIVADSRVRDFHFPRYERIAEMESSTLPDLDESREFNRVSLYRGR